MVDHVEARLDIRVQHPAVTPAAEQVDLSDRVLRPPPGPKPIGDRHEVGLKDGFQHELGRCLDNTVGHGRDAQPAHLPVPTGFRDQSLAHWPGAETLGLEHRAQTLQETPGGQPARCQRRGRRRPQQIWLPCCPRPGSTRSTAWPGHI